MSAKRRYSVNLRLTGHQISQLWELHEWLETYGGKNAPKKSLDPLRVVATIATRARRDKLDENTITE